MEASDHLHMPDNLLFGKERPVTYWVGWSVVFWAGSENRYHFCTSWISSHDSCLVPPPPFIDAALPAQFQAGYKLNWGGDCGFELGWRLPQWRFPLLNCAVISGVPSNFFGGGVTPWIFSGGGGVKKIQLRTEDKENGDLGAVAP
jgi:hypothetical protein